MERKPPKLPPVRSWLEPVDEHLCAANAEVRQVKPRRFWDPELGRTVQRPFLYGLAVFVLVEHRRGIYGAKLVAEQLLRDHLATRGNRLPPIGVVEGEAFTDPT